MNVTKDIARDNARKLGIPDFVEIPDFDEKFNGSHNRQDYQKKYYPEFYKYVLDIYPFIKTHAERMYLFLNGMSEPPRCPECGNYAVFNSNHKYSTYCSRACGVHNEHTKEITRQKKMSRTPEERAETIRKRKETNIERYGVENPMELKEIKEKQKRSTFERYGVEYSLQVQEVRDKGKKTCVKKYGYENALQSPAVKQKIKSTCLERYGVDNPSKCKEILERQKMTISKRYGVTNIMESPEFVEKQRLSVKAHYGVDNPFESKEIQEQIKIKNREQYGCDWNCQRIKNRKESEPNKKFRELLEKYNIDYESEFSIGKYIYDFKVNDILFEISPSITHNTNFNPFGGNPIDKDYHKEKSLFAKDNGYNMVEIWDWDNAEEIILETVKYKYQFINASDLDVGFIPVEMLTYFICIIDSFKSGNNGEIDDELRDDLIFYLNYSKYTPVGLFKDNVLYSAMLLKNCDEGGLEPGIFKTIPGIEIVGGLKKMIDFSLKNDKLPVIPVVIYTDFSKSDWRYYLDNDFDIDDISGPNKIMYSLKKKTCISPNEFKSKIEEIHDSIIKDLVMEEVKKVESENNLKSEDLDEEEFEHLCIYAETEISDLPSTQMKIQSEIDKYIDKLRKDKYVDVYDCGKLKLVYKK